MQSLLSGADCAVGANPLHQALKSFSHDTSLQRDLAAGSGQQAAAGPSHQFRQQQQQGGSNADAERFFQSANQRTAFDMGDLRQAAVNVQNGPQQQNIHRMDSPVHQGWAQDFQSMPDYQNIPEVERMSGNGTSTMGNLQNQPGNYASRYRYQPGMVNSMGYGQFGAQNMGMPLFQTEMPIDQSQNFTNKGKGKADDRFIELSDDQWESEFSKFAQVDAEEAARMENATQEGNEETTEEEDDLLKEIDKKWRSMTNSFEHQNAADKEMSAWEAQYASQFSDPDFEAPQTQVTVEDLMDHARDQEWSNLTPEQENQYKEHSDPFAEGKRLLAEGAPFNLVEQAFEEAVRRDETRSEAWVALGETLAADEKELLAIRALEKAIAGNSRGVESAWLSLAISFINEGQDPKAMVALQEWLTRCYPQMIGPGEHPFQNSQLENSENPWQGQQKMIDLFLKAARSGPSARSAVTRQPELEDGASFIDADVQIGLGVLFYSNHDYAYAKDCFEAALSVRPKDYILWNRLGATLANGGQPEEAISAYRQALALRPNFTRSLYNLAVSCLNINCAHEAAEHLLAALEMQGNSGKGEESGPLWSTLRRAFFQLERPDLANRANMGQNVADFRKEGFSF